MVPTALRIVFNRENAGLGPETAMTDHFDDLAKCEVIISHLRRRGGATGFRAAGMIIGQTDDNQIGEFPGSLELF